MPVMTRTRRSTRIADATAANAPAPAPAPVPAATDDTQAAQGDPSSPRRTRSGKVLGQVAAAAAKLTRGRRGRKAIAAQEVTEQAEDKNGVVPTTDAAPAPQPLPAPATRKRGAKAPKKQAKTPETVAEVTPAGSSTVAPAPAPAPRKRAATTKRTKSNRAKSNKGKSKAIEPVVDDVPAPTSPQPLKAEEGIDRVSEGLREVNSTLLGDDKIVKAASLEYQSFAFYDTRLPLWKVPRDALGLLHHAHVQEQPPIPGLEDDGYETEVVEQPDVPETGFHAAVWHRLNFNPFVLPSVLSARRKNNRAPVASTSKSALSARSKQERRQPQPQSQSQPPAASTSTAEREPVPPRRSDEVNGGRPEDNQTGTQQPQQQPAASTSSASQAAPSPRTHVPLRRHAAFNWGSPNGSRRTHIPLQKHAAVNLGVPENWRQVGQPSRDKARAVVAALQRARSEAPPVVSGDAAAVSASTAAPAAGPSASTAAPAAGPSASTAAPAAAPSASTAPAAAGAKVSPTSSTDSADLEEVEASIRIDDDGEEELAGATFELPGPVQRQPDLPSGEEQAGAAAAPSSGATSSLTRQHAAIFDSQGHVVPTYNEVNAEVIEAVMARTANDLEAARVLRAVKAERDGQDPQDLRVVPLTRYRPPPPPPGKPTKPSRTSARAAASAGEAGPSGSRSAHGEDDDKIVKEVISSVLLEIEEERAARKRSSGVDVSVVGHEPAPVASTSQSQTETTLPGKPESAGMNMFAKGRKNGRKSIDNVVPGSAPPSPSPSPDKGKKRAREPEPEGPRLWGYTASTGPMNSSVSVVPLVPPPPKRRRMSPEEDGDAGVPPNPAPAPALAPEPPSSPAPVFLRASAPSPAPAPAPAPVPDVQDTDAPAPSLEASTQETRVVRLKRSREEFEDGSSRTRASADERPKKKTRRNDPDVE